MEAMRKEIVRLNEIIAKGCMDEKAHHSGKKVEEPKRPQYKNGLGHTKGAKTNGRKLVNGFECVQFEKELIGTVQPIEPVAVLCKRAAVPLVERQCRAPQKREGYQSGS